MDKGITREQVERAARIYKSNQDTGRALDIDPRSFARLCRQYGIETPYVRKRRRRASIGARKTRPKEPENHPWNVRVIYP